MSTPVRIRVVNTATVEVDPDALREAGLTAGDLHGYVVRDLQELGVEYHLEVDDYHWEAT